MRNGYTVGVEEEYQLVDMATGVLRSRASDVLSTDWADEIQGEMHETTVEVNTRVCHGIESLESELRRARFQAATTAAAEGLEIAAAGTHPFSADESGLPAEGRADGPLDSYDPGACEVNVFGMHIHVGVPEDLDRSALLEQVRGFVPHLLALSASSPFSGGSDTGFASYRSIVGRLSPYTGIPPRFDSDQEFQRFVALLLRGSGLARGGESNWSVRPHFRYPTIEFRATDVCPRLDDAVTIAAFTRLLVAAVAEGHVAPHGGGDHAGESWQAERAANEWRAARYGMDARLADPSHPGGEITVRDSVTRLIDLLEPTAMVSGEVEVLERMTALLERGSGADQLRRVYAETGCFRAVVAWMVRETRLGTGSDRRRAQRVNAT